MIIDKGDDNDNDDDDMAFLKVSHDKLSLTVLTIQMYTENQVYAVPVTSMSSPV